MVAAIFCNLLLPGEAMAQGETNKWQRVISGADENVDVSVTSLVLEPHRLIRAKFRTTLSKSENVAGNPEKKYKVRLDTIQFNPSESEYRIAETILLDSSGRLISSFAQDSTEGWQKMKSPTANRLFQTALNLSPFGLWKVISYRETDSSKSKNAQEDLKNVVGSLSSVLFDRVQIGKETCSTPLYESEIMTNEVFTRLTATPTNVLGFTSESLNIIKLKCESAKTFSPTNLLIGLPSGHLLMLWNGLVIELENVRERSISLPIIIKE